MISPDSFNGSQDDVVLAAMTSQFGSIETIEFAVLQDDLAEGFLPKPSVLKPTKLFTARASLVIKKIGSLRADKLDAILEWIREFFSSRRNEAEPESLATNLPAESLNDEL